MDFSDILYFFPQIFSACVSVWVAVIAWQRRKVPGAAPLAILALAETVWSLAHLRQLISPSLSEKLVWDNIEFIGAVLAPLACLGFALEYNASRTSRLGFPWKSLAILSVLVMAFIWSDGLHNLFRSSARIVPGYSASALTYEPGPAFAVYILYAYSLVAFAILLLLINMINGSRVYRPQVGLLLAGMLIPWLPGMIDQTGLVTAKLYPYTPLTFGPSNLLIAWSLFRYRLLEILPVARASLIENISDGVLVLDPGGVIIDCNPSACKILRLSSDKLIGETIHNLLEVPEGFLTRDELRPTQKTELATSGHGTSETFEIEVRQLQAGEKLITGYLLVLHNITEQKKTENNLRRSMALLEAVIQSSTNGLIVIDSDLSVVLFNPRLAAILDLPERWENLDDPEKIQTLANCYQQPRLFYEVIEELLKNPLEHRLITLETRQGRILNCSISAYQAGQDKAGWLFSYQDVTDQKQAEEKLRNLAITDSLTNVFNRRHFFSLAQNEIERARRYNRDLSIILFDIDHFKSVNDSFGHLVGDQVLEMLASYCKSNLRSFDVIGRYGGEEFIVLLPETNLRRAAQIAERLRRQALAVHIPTEHGSPSITISLGVAGIKPGQPATLDELINTADKALYRVKAEGRNHVCALYVGEADEPAKTDISRQEGG
jgi:diguanylate cyclase (GGDEF)-like protein/PAS domain S-box-containing protein